MDIIKHLACLPSLPIPPPKESNKRKESLPSPAFNPEQRLSQSDIDQHSLLKSSPEPLSASGAELPCIAKALLGGGLLNSPLSKNPLNLSNFFDVIQAILSGWQKETSLSTSSELKKIISSLLSKIRTAIDFAKEIQSIKTTDPKEVSSKIEATALDYTKKTKDLSPNDSLFLPVGWINNSNEGSETLFLEITCLPTSNFDIRFYCQSQIGDFFKDLIVNGKLMQEPVAYFKDVPKSRIIFDQDNSVHSNFFQCLIDLQTLSFVDPIEKGNQDNQPQYAAQNFLPILMYLNPYYHPSLQELKTSKRGDSDGISSSLAAWMRSHFSNFSDYKYFKFHFKLRALILLFNRLKPDIETEDNSHDICLILKAATENLLRAVAKLSQLSQAEDCLKDPDFILKVRATCYDILRFIDSVETTKRAPPLEAWPLLPSEVSKKFSILNISQPQQEVQPSNNQPVAFGCPFIGPLNRNNTLDSLQAATKHLQLTLKKCKTSHNFPPMDQATQLIVNMLTPVIPINPDGPNELWDSIPHDQLKEISYYLVLILDYYRAHNLQEKNPQKYLIDTLTLLSSIHYICIKTQTEESRKKTINFSSIKMPVFFDPCLRSWSDLTFLSFSDYQAYQLLVKYFTKYADQSTSVLPPHPNNNFYTFNDDDGPLKNLYNITRNIFENSPNITTQISNTLKTELDNIPSKTSEPTFLLRLQTAALFITQPSDPTSDCFHNFIYALYLVTSSVNPLNALSYLKIDESGNPVLYFPSLYTSNTASRCSFFLSR